MALELASLYKDLRVVLPTSPHSSFDEKKTYRTLKPKIDEIFEAEFDVILISRKLEAALTPMGMNYHFFNYLAPIYGEMFRVLKQFEKVFKTCPPEVKAYYEAFKFPESSSIFEKMNEDFLLLLPSVEQELKEAMERNPLWTEWEQLPLIEADKVKELFKEASKAKEK